MAQQTIGLDCGLFLPRPDQLIGPLLEDTGLKVRPPLITWRGCWIWDYSDIPPDQWQKAEPILKSRILEWYHSGLIYGGSW
jgi:hypothetical protein